jgi:hypothetical protein
MVYDILQGETMAEYYNGLKEGFKHEKEENLWLFDPIGWHKHTDYHFSQKINGNRVDYYPSTKVILLNGKRQSRKKVNELLSQLRGE